MGCPAILEGKAKFQIGNAFYRDESRMARDLGVLAAAIYRADTGRLRVLDAMAGCGVRSLRYWQESGADWVWTNEGNPDIGPTLRINLEEAIASQSCQLTHLDANRVFFDCYSRSDYYDLVDVDSFGNPAPYLSTSLWAVALGGLLYLTSTDGRAATGHAPNRSLSAYGAYARSHPAAHEQGLRLLIGSAQQQAASKGFGIEPVFSLFTGEVYRVMLRLVSRAGLNDENYGFLGYCHHCGDYQTVGWRQLGKSFCPHDRESLTISGPLWLGPLHDRPYVQRMADWAEQWQWPEGTRLLQIMSAEADLPPYFYLLGEIGRRGRMDIPRRSHLIQALQDLGYQASATHVNAEAIKTNASLKICIQAAQKLSIKK